MLLFRMALLGLLPSLYAQSTMNLPGWWQEDGRIDESQRQDLQDVAENPQQWCALVDLWLGTDEAQAQGCESAHAVDRPMGVRWSTQMDSAGVGRSQTWQAQWKKAPWQLTGNWLSDSGWQNPSLQKAQLAYHTQNQQFLGGDFTGSEVAWGWWSVDFRGAWWGYTLPPWTLSALASQPQIFGLGILWKPKGPPSTIRLWGAMAQEHPSGGFEIRHSKVQWKSRWADPRQGSWNHLRFRESWSPVTVGGDVYLRLGTDSIPLMEPPRTFADVLIWSTQWQEVKQGDWRLRFTETSVIRNASDSVALSLEGERRRPAGRLVAQATCRAAQKGCGLPRTGLGAGWKPTPQSKDSVFAELRLQGKSLHHLAHTPRLRCGWARQLGSSVQLQQSLTVPENTRPHTPWTWRQESRLRLPILAGVQSQFLVRCNTEVSHTTPLTVKDFALQIQSEW